MGRSSPVDILSKSGDAVTSELTEYVSFSGIFCVLYSGYYGEEIKDFCGGG